MESKDSKSEIMNFASLAAHQLKSPVVIASTILKTLLGEYAGPLSKKQKDMLANAIARCNQAIESAQRMMVMARFSKQVGVADFATDITAVVYKLQRHYADDVEYNKIWFTVEMDEQSMYVRCQEEILVEVVNALLNNAFKYTPKNGHIRISITHDLDKKMIGVSVADSGIGIPKQDCDKVFEPFYRSESAEASARLGTGLGLSFVKTVVEAAGGSVHVGKADLGGAEFSFYLPVAEEPVEDQGARKMSSPMKVVIIGGVVAGPKAASKIIRLMPESEVTIVEKNKLLSVAGCALPYYISGVVQNQIDLLSSPLGAVRDPVFFQQVKNVRAMNQTEALAIDPVNKTVRVRNCITNEESSLEYDKLMLATGSIPVTPAIPGANLDNIFTMHGLPSAEGIRMALAQGKARDVVIVGGGLLGVEITETIVEQGCRVTIVEKKPQILRLLDWEMAALVEQYLESKGVKIIAGTKVESFQGRDGKIDTVVTDQGPIPADMVIMAIGFRPNVKLAQAAGLELGSTGAIKVDKQMRTSDPNIYAAGDCVETVGMLTGRPRYMPYGSVANKQGRVAANSICGRHDEFPGVLGSAVWKVFNYCVARTGLIERDARELGYEVTTVLSPAPDRSHYMPTAKQIMLKIVVDTKTRKLLGIQAVGPGACDKRIDVAVMALIAGMTVDQIANADLCYAPPYAPAMDNIITAANIARNKLNGDMVGISPIEVHRMRQEKENFIFLDVRTPGEHEQVRLSDTLSIPFGSLRGRLNELPKDADIVTFCTSSLRGYEAGLVLRAAGFEKVRVMDGGINMWPYEKIQ
ncbi:MAG: FAD-dependent oxidoreductase [Planctomycetota bacterium]|nr:MAG: FAD-dependent oxidoreductase [Planctomycetota bacterium]